MSRIEEELALQKLMARYVDAANRRDGEAWATTWAEDGCWNLMGMEVTGRDNILQLWQQVVAGFEFAILMPSSHLFQVEGERASGHWYLQEFTRDLQGEKFAAMSRYLDEYVKVDGQWLFQSRRYDFLYRGPADLSGDFTALP
ncbi:nuclear transport factor 2 family protein [Seongchinamella unica]|uniref:Nuclear transport factor 2 family protein n=1 Tax=Seongchinamella unica TaxID=2547392 RepID=A0A4V2ZXM2_9GAMM|nr:nuclear transport factor 2 family protein [Seongchinamella unica]TDG14855.1 nuclear transport factor 2 family protein [Seongchinamella unica]